MITFALMVGTAGLPHIIIRFFTTPTIRGARASAGWALLFIAILYTTAPAVASFARLNMIHTLNNKSYTEAPSWFKNWEKTGLVAWKDKNGDGKIQYAKGNAFKGKIAFDANAVGPYGERVVTTPLDETSTNELYIDRDIMVLANPEIAKLPAWVIALVAAGGLAAALSTAAGLLLVIASAFSHDLIKNVIAPGISEKGELIAARIAAGGRSHGGRILRHPSPGIRCTGRSLCLRSCGLLVLPGYHHGGLLEEGHKGRRNSRHALRDNFYRCIYHLLQVRKPGYEQG